MAGNGEATGAAHSKARHGKARRGQVGRGPAWHGGATGTALRFRDLLRPGLGIGAARQGTPG